MMAQPKWLKKYLTMKPEVNKIYDDLDNYRQFCVDFGHYFDEKDLYNHHSQSWQDFMRRVDGKYIKNRWFAKPDDERRDFKPRNTNGRGYNNYRTRNNNA
jgi:hypothetical protein